MPLRIIDLLAVEVEQFKIVNPEQVRVNQRRSQLLGDLTDVHIEETNPEDEHVAGHRADKPVQLNNIKAFYKLVFWDRLHHHGVLESYPGGLKEDVLEL